MTFIDKLTRNQHAVLSTVRLWLIFVSCAAVATALIALVQRFEAAWAGPPAPMAQGIAKPAPSAVAMPHAADAGEPAAGAP